MYGHYTEQGGLSWKPTLECLHSAAWIDLFRTIRHTEKRSSAVEHNSGRVLDCADTDKGEHSGYC